MVTAKCLKCGGSAIAETFELARKLINHAVGLSRGIKCGDNYNLVKEIKSQSIAKKTPKPETLIPVITNASKSEKTKSTTSSEKPREKSKQMKSSV